MIAILMTEMASWRSTEYEWSNLRLKFPEAAEKVPRKASALRLPLVCHGSLGPERDDRADVGPYPNKFSGHVQGREVKSG